MPNILTPWSLPSHQKIGGFDPVYRDWMRLQVDTHFVRPPWLYELDRPALDGIAVDSTGGYGPAFELPQIAAVFDPRDLAFSAQISADVELLHTVPLTSGHKPFLFLCRTMAELFWPLTHTGRPTRYGALSSLLPIYRNLFLSDACIAILFHSLVELEEFAKLFPEAGAKLKLLPMCLPPVEVKTPLAGRPPTLLFTTWPQSDGDPLVLHGAVMALKALDMLRQARPEARLIFAAPRASSTLMNWSETVGEEGGILRQPALRSLIEQNTEAIIWIDDHLSEAALRRLFQSCDLSLWLGLKVHWMSVVASMINGCVPVVANLPSASKWVKQNHTGIILDTLDQTVLSINDYGFVDLSFSDFYSAHDMVLARTVEAIPPAINLATNPSALASFRAEMLKGAERQFQGYAARRQLANIIGQTQFGEGDLEISKAVDFASDFQNGAPRHILSLGDRQILTAGGGFSTMPTAGHAGEDKLFNSLPQAMADLLRLDLRSPQEILLDEIARTARPSLSEEGLVQPLADREGIKVRNISDHLYTVPTVHNPNGGYLRPWAEGLGVLPDPAPWIYGFFLPLNTAILGDADWIMLETGPTEAAFGVSLLNRAGKAFVSKLKTPTNKRSTELWLPIKNSQDVGALVVHNWDKPLKSEVVLRRLFLVRDAETRES